MATATDIQKERSLHQLASPASVPPRPPSLLDEGNHIQGWPFPLSWYTNHLWKWPHNHAKKCDLFVYLSGCSRGTESIQRGLIGLAHTICTEQSNNGCLTLDMPRIWQLLGPQAAALASQSGAEGPEDCSKSHLSSVMLEAKETEFGCW